MFRFRLALALGRTVAELDESISSAELTEWMAYANVEPWGYPMDNYRMAVPAAALINAVYASIPLPKSKRPRSVQPSDFYPQQRQSTPGLSPSQAEYIRKKHGKRRHRRN